MKIIQLSWLIPSWHMLSRCTAISSHRLDCWGHSSNKCERWHGTIHLWTCSKKHDHVTWRYFQKLAQLDTKKHNEMYLGHTWDYTKQLICRTWKKKNNFQAIKNSKLCLIKDTQRPFLQYHTTLPHPDKTCNTMWMQFMSSYFINPALNACWGFMALTYLLMRILVAHLPHSTIYFYASRQGNIFLSFMPWCLIKMKSCINMFCRRLLSFWIGSSKFQPAQQTLSKHSWETHIGCLFHLKQAWQSIWFRSYISHPMKLHTRWKLEF